MALNAQMQSLYWYGPPEDLRACCRFPTASRSDGKRTRSGSGGLSAACVAAGLCLDHGVSDRWHGGVWAVRSWSVRKARRISSPASIRPRWADQDQFAGAVSTPGLYRSTDTTVLYVSQNGLIQISSSGAGQNVTEGWISRERWQELTPQKNIRAIKHATSYFAFGQVQGQTST